MTISVHNFGCRLNTYEGEVIRGQAQEAGLDNAIIFNSCAVTSEAERQVRQAIRRARWMKKNQVVLELKGSAVIRLYDCLLSTMLMVFPLLLLVLNYSLYRTG